MKRFSLMLILLLIAVMLTTFAAAQGPDDSNPSGDRAAAALGNDSNPAGAPEVVIPDEFQPAVGDRGPSAVDANSTVYFTPQDENTSTTVIFLYNTSSTNRTVRLETFNLTGGDVIDTTISVPAHRLVRIAGDPVSTISGTWQSAVLVNFTTSSTYGRLTLPPGIKVEAYVAWNGGNTYDPLDAVPTLPIRLSQDPAAVFLPMIEGGS